MRLNIFEKRKELQNDLKALDNSLEIRKEMILCEVSFIEIKKALNLNHFEKQLLMLGKLDKNKMNEVWEYLSKVREDIKNRDLKYKKFKIYLLENGITWDKASKDLNLPVRNIRAILTGERTNRQFEIEKKIETFCKMNLFN